MIEINNWDSYKKWVAATVNGGAEYYFRGQKDPKWKLQTTFHRYSQKTEITLDSYLKNILPEVSYYVSASQKENIDISNPTQFWALLGKLQHHGFPTPLLDWSLSPYIAAFFAYKDIDSQNKPESNFVKIYMFDFKQWKDSFQQPVDLNATSGFVSAYQPPAINNSRMIQQMAVTTVTNILDLESHLINSASQRPKPFLYSATLPVHERKLVMNELNLMGINSMTLFPDFDGICSSMKEKYFNNLDISPLVPAPPAPEFNADVIAKLFGTNK